MIFLPDELSLEQRQRFWRNYTPMCELFGRSFIDSGLNELKINQIVELYKSPLMDAYGEAKNGSCFISPNEFMATSKECYSFTNTTGWSKSMYVPCKIYLVPYQYQGNHHAQIIKPALLYNSPWLETFQFMVYQFSTQGNEEFYVSIKDTFDGHTTIYVPYSAFLAHDADAIRNRNITYLHSYHYSDKEKADKIWQSITSCPEGVRFFSYFE